MLDPADRLGICRDSERFECSGTELRWDSLPKSTIPVRAHLDSGRHAAWPQRRPWWSGGRIVSTAIFCASLLIFTSIIPTASASGGGGGSGAGSYGWSNNSTSLFDYPYSVPPSAYPFGAIRSSPVNVTGVAIAPLPGAVSTYAVTYSTLNTSGGATSASLWFDIASYSPVDAKEILSNGSCGPNCGQLPISWSGQSLVTSSSHAITAEGIGSMGTALIIAVTAGGQTNLYNWSVGSSSWVQFGPAISGQFASLAADPEAAVVVTLAGGFAEVTTIGAAGSALGQASLSPSGCGSAPITGASGVLAPVGAAYLESVVLSVAGCDEILFSSSVDGVHFASPSFVANYSGNYSDFPLPSVGQTSAVDPGGLAGQVALAAVGAQLFLLFTTNQSGQTVPVSEASGNGGATWQGPYFDGPLNGTALDPAVTVGPDGLVYATWMDPDYGPGAVDAAIYFSDGYPTIAPETIVSSSTPGTSPVGAPVIAVDGLNRPLLVWPSSSNNSGALAYTGGYLNSSAALSFLSNATAEALTGPDFPGGSSGSSAALSSLVANVSRSVASAETNLTPNGLCNAQNITALSIYQNLTHVPLSWQQGTGTVCASSLSPSTRLSPILQSQGIDAPNTFMAVYADWALEAEGVMITVSPLSEVAQFNPYNEVIPSAALPKVVSNSTSASSKTVSVTASPTPYSPTAYEIAVSATIPTWTKTSTGPVCAPPPNLQRFSYSYTTAVSSTWVNLSINNGAMHSFSGTTSYSSVWLYDLPAYQSFSWYASLSARTSEIEQITNPCTHSTTTQNVTPVSYGPTSIPTMSLSGTFATTLSISYGSSFLTATYNSNHSAAKLSTNFATTLPANVSGALLNTTGYQLWNSSSMVTAQSYAFSKYSGVNVAYTLNLNSMSRVGTSSSPGSPSFAVGSSGAAPSESVWASCSFTLTSSLPNVTYSSRGPFWDNASTSVDVSWSSTADAPGFITYYEVGSAINSTISGITPVSAGSGNWNYTIQLHGLEPSEAYQGVVGVSWAQGCLTDQDGVDLQSYSSSSDPATATPTAVPSFWEQDLRYDSVTQSGGGIRLSWDNPTTAKKGIVNTGVATISGPGGPWVLPFVKAQVVQHINGTYLQNQLNLSPPLTSGGRYSATIELNYTTILHPIVSSNSANFAYHLDTSGNGLTNNEQEAGWNVTLQPCFAVSGLGKACGILKRAYPGAYATNGLASDFLEKELDLNPNTLDSATSHMLDLWNLTFSLLSNGVQQSVPKGIRVWWENSSLNPFHRA